MDANLDTIAKDLYGKIQTRFPDIRIGDEEANVLSKKQDIPKARFFEFEYKEDGDEIGTISVTLDADEGVVLEVSGDIVSKKHPGAFKFIRSFRQFAKDRLLNYDVKRMGKSNLDKRDYAFRSKVKDDMIMENKLFGTSKISYQDLGEARLIIKHSQQINPELAAGRTMHIENIYIENAAGERFRYPAKHLNGARALAEHIKAGGNPYDGIGQHITSLSEELASLRKFKNYVGRQEQLSEAMGDITSKVMERIDSIKKEIHSLQRPAYYQQFAESFVQHEEQMIPEAVMDDWIDRLTIRTFNEELKGVFPYIFKLVDESELPVRELSADDLLDEETLPWETDAEAKEREGGKKDKSPFKKAHNPNRTGSDAAKALAQKGIPKKEGFDPEQAFEDFMNGILPEAGVASQTQGGIFDPQQRPAAVAELNNIFKSEVKGGPDDINLGKIKELIPDPEFAAMLDQLGGSGDLDVRSGIEVILNQMGEHNKELAQLLQAGQIQFSNPEGDTPVGGQDVAAPEAPEAPVAPAEPEAPVAPTEAEPVREGMGKLKAKLIKAVECGAGPDTELEFGSRKMSLMSALKECGIDPASVGMKSQSGGTGIQEILKSIAGFWNKDATITEGNFTIGGQRTKQKVITGFKNGEYENATKEDVSKVLHMIDKMDPPSDMHGGNDLNRMKQMAGVGKTSEMSEDPMEDDFAKFMQDHPNADIEGMVSKWKQDQSSNTEPKDAAPIAPAQTSQSSTSNQTGTIDGKPSSHADAMAKFRDIAKGMKLKLPGMDGQDGPDLDFSDPSKMGSQIQSHVGNMMKGMQGKMPQGKVELPGGMGNLDPNAMMQQLMSKMPKTGMPQGNTSSSDMEFKPGNQSNLLQVDNPEYVAKRAAALQKPGAVVGHTTMESNNELASWLKIAGIK